MKHNIFLKIRKTAYLSLYALDRFLGLKPRLVILCYHGIARSDWKFDIAFKQFERQVAYLSKNYNFLSLEDINLYKVGSLNPSVILTFDDGYKDLLSIRKICKKYGVKPALFVLSDNKKADKRELGNSKKFLNKKEILTLIRDGWTIGSHSATHKDFYKLTSKKVIEEVIDSKNDLEKKLGREVKYFAYPRGRYSKKILKAVKKAGYQMAFTMDDNFINKNSNLLKLPRIGVDGSHSFSEFCATMSPSNIILRSIIKKFI